MTDEHRFSRCRVWRCGGNHRFIEIEVACNRVGLQCIRAIGVAFRRHVPSSANLGSNVMVLVLERRSVWQLAFLALEYDFDRREQWLAFGACRSQKISRDSVLLFLGLGNLA